MRLYLKYQSLKPEAALKPDYRFFLTAKNVCTTKYEDMKIWYSEMPMGIHTLG